MLTLSNAVLQPAGWPGCQVDKAQVNDSRFDHQMIQMIKTIAPRSAQPAPVWHGYPGRAVDASRSKQEAPVWRGGAGHALWIVQNKTKAKRAIEITGELAALIERIDARPRERLSAWLIQDDDGKPLGTFGLRSRFDKARRAAGVEFQFRDIRAKAATDTGDLAHSQKLLGHRNREMTEQYVRARVGERVSPLR